MKKRLLIISLAVMLAFAGCGKEKKSDKKNDTTSENAVDISEENMIKAEYSDDYYVMIPDVNDKEFLKSILLPTDEEIDEVIDTQIKSTLKNMVPCDHEEAQIGDIVDISYAGYMDGVQFDGGTGSSSDVELGSGMFIPGFEEGVVGMKVGETKDVVVTFPEDYGATDLAGKEATFKITLDKIKGTKAEGEVELTDEIISANLGSYDINTVDELRAYIRNSKIASNIEAMNKSCKIYDKSGTEGVYDKALCESNYNMLVACYGGSSGEMTEDSKAKFQEAAEDLTFICMTKEVMAKELKITVTDKDYDEYVKASGFVNMDEMCTTLKITKEYMYYEVIAGLVDEELRRIVTEE